MTLLVNSAQVCLRGIVSATASASAVTELMQHVT
jgi:hypothetical protein